MLYCYFLYLFLNCLHILVHLLDGYNNMSTWNMLPSVPGDCSVFSLFIVITALSDRYYYYHSRMIRKTRIREVKPLGQHSIWWPAGFEQWLPTAQTMLLSPQKTLVCNCCLKILSKAVNNAYYTIVCPTPRPPHQALIVHAQPTGNQACRLPQLK